VFHRLNAVGVMLENAVMENKNGIVRHLYARTPAYVELLLNLFERFRFL